jgi:hypothetical protein
MWKKGYREINYPQGCSHLWIVVFSLFAGVFRGSLATINEEINYQSSCLFARFFWVAYPFMVADGRDLKIFPP